MLVNLYGFQQNPHWHVWLTSKCVKRGWYPFLVAVAAVWHIFTAVYNIPLQIHFQVNLSWDWPYLVKSVSGGDMRVMRWAARCLADRLGKNVDILQNFGVFWYFPSTFSESFESTDKLTEDPAYGSSIDTSCIDVSHLVLGRGRSSFFPSHFAGNLYSSCSPSA